MNRHPDKALEKEDPLDREISQALAGLPREGADAGFTAQILRRLDDPPSHGFRWQPVLAGAALATALVAVLLAAGVLRPASRTPEAPGPVIAATDGAEDPVSSETPPIAVRSPEPRVASRTPSPRRAPSQEPQATAKVASSTRPRSDAGALLEELRREHTRLERDLRDLRELADGSQVLYVGGDESLDFVLDLASEPTSAGGPDVRPAALQRPGPGDGLRFF